MTFTIYGVIGSRASRCIWTAEEAGVTYDWKPISTLDGSNKSAEFLAINPTGKIPALSDDGGVVMTESLAINMYIAQQYGHGTIWPADKADQARALQWTFWSATEIEYYIGALFPHLVMKKEEDRDYAFVEQLKAQMMPKLNELEAALDGKEYLLADFSIADINVCVQLLTITRNFKFDISGLPNVQAWLNRCIERPGRVKVDTLASLR
jgi:glutathione S-transferase